MEGLRKKCIILVVISLLIITNFASISYANNVNINAKNNHKNSYPLSGAGDYEYIIITNEYLENSDFQRLIQHKSQYRTARIVTIEEILSNPDFKYNGKYGDATNAANGNHWIPNGKEVTRNYSTFDDDQARIRNFLRFAYDDWGTQYVLLGGDVQIIPVRKLRINETWWYGGLTTMWTFANIRADFYYTALDGTWNDDFDEHFGEASPYSVDDEADYIAELYIGRAPVDNKRDVKVFVDKVIQFETSEKPENMLFHQAGINPLNVPDSSVVPEQCYEHVPDHYIVYKLYQINTNINPAKYVRHWQDPDKLIVLHVGSGDGSTYYMERRVTGDSKFTCEDIDRFNNTFLPVHMSLSCNSGNFGLNYDCLSENLLLHPGYGPSACIFNSFFGVASENNAHKYSGEFLEQQFYEIFENGVERLGEIVAKSKYNFIENAQNELLYRWCYYTVYLLGDPETSLFEVRNKIPIVDQVSVDDDYDENTPGWGVTHFDNIQSALNCVADSGTISVNSGTYSGNFDLNKPVNLIGEDKDSTFIIGEGNGDVIKIYDEVKISGFTIKNSGNSNNDAGIKIHSKMNIINDNTITENNYGIKTEGSGNNEIKENRIYNNNFIDNSENAYDDFEGFYYGNYWDDYTGSDTNSDGIGDDPYNFDILKDHCPFMVESGWDLGENHKPILPIIYGPSTGKTNEDYPFFFQTADPDGDDVYIYIDMGDGAYFDWEGPYESHDITEILYYYEQIGVYTIRVRAKDEHGSETEVVKHRIVISRSRAVTHNPYSLFNILMKVIKILNNLKVGT